LSSSDRYGRNTSRELRTDGKKRKRTRCRTQFEWKRLMRQMYLRRKEGAER
jgi:hypothetical protein